MKQNAKHSKPRCATSVCARIQYLLLDLGRVRGAVVRGTLQPELVALSR